jgi:transcriptional regulator with XRE-family HTH domain
VESHLDKKLAFQIRGLRGELSQDQMEERVGIKQQVLSRLENPYYGKATLTTLKKIAAAYDVGLLVEFVPFSELAKRVSGTPYIERGYSPETLDVPSFEEEEKRGVFQNQAITTTPIFYNFTIQLSTFDWQAAIEAAVNSRTPMQIIGNKKPQSEKVVILPAGQMPAVAVSNL